MAKKKRLSTRIRTILKSAPATTKALKKSGSRIKKRFFTLIKKTKKSVKQMTRKVDRTVAKRIRSITHRR